ncbi:MAG: hypothetical protein K8L91_33695 [Anaerolineae bacterium]|nr:hypothetical protein [Anaerolineae bacterium]
MLTHRWFSILIFVLLCLSSGSVLAQDGTVAKLNRPPLVACIEGEAIPCVVNVEEASQITGVWRGYIDGATAMGFIAFSADGSYSISADVEGEPTITGTVTFAVGSVLFTPNDDGNMSLECATPARYEIRVLRVGEKPVALAYRLAGKDDCLARTLDFSEPALHYVDNSAELLPFDATQDPVAQTLVACPDEMTAEMEPYACDRFATEQADIAGIWKLYYGDAMNKGMGFGSYNGDGNFVNADTPEHTTSPATGFQHGNGTYLFDEGLVTYSGSVEADGEACAHFTYRLRVIHFGQQRVAISYTPIEDACVQIREWADPMILVSD